MWRYHMSPPCIARVNLCMGMSVRNDVKLELVSWPHSIRNDQLRMGSPRSATMINYAREVLRAGCT